jgi:hypothetical protein
MSDIYEQKAKKYKYKYLKLKQEYIGEGGSESLSQLLELNEIKKSINNNEYEYHLCKIDNEVNNEIDINNLENNLKKVTVDEIKNIINKRIDKLKKIANLNFDELQLAILNHLENNYLKAIEYNVNNETNIDKIQNNLNSMIKSYNSKTGTDVSLEKFINEIKIIINKRITELKQQQYQQQQQQLQLLQAEYFYANTR